MTAAARRRQKPSVSTEFAVLARETIELTIARRFGGNRRRASEEWGVPYSTLTDILLGVNAIGSDTLSQILVRERQTPVEFFLQHPRCRGAAGGVAPWSDDEEELFHRFMAAAGGMDQAAKIVARVERASKLGVLETLGQSIHHGLEMAEQAANSASTKAKLKGKRGRRKP